MDTSQSSYILMTMSTRNTTEEYHNKEIISEKDILGSALNSVFLTIKLMQCTLSLLCNLLVILVVWISDELRKCPFNHLIASLMVSHTIASLGLFFEIIRGFWSTAAEPLSAVCFMQLVLSITSWYGTLYMILLLAIDRYFYRKKLEKYNSIMNRNGTTIIIICMWIVVAMQVGLLSTLGMKFDSGLPCKISIAFKSDAHLSGVVQFILITVLCIIPLSIWIGIHLKKSKVVIVPSSYQDNTENEDHGIQMTNEMEMTETINFILVIYIVSCAPYVLFDIVTSNTQVIPYSLQILIAGEVLEIVYCLPMVINPLLICFKNAEFLKSLRDLLRLNNNRVENEAVQIESISTRVEQGSVGSAHGLSGLVNPEFVNSLMPLGKPKQMRRMAMSMHPSRLTSIESVEPGCSGFSPTLPPIRERVKRKNASANLLAGHLNIQQEDLRWVSKSDGCTVTSTHVNHGQNPYVMVHRDTFSSISEEYLFPTTGWDPDLESDLQEPRSSVSPSTPADSMVCLHHFAMN